MSTKFHLLLDRSQFETTDITQLEELLLKYATSEGETNWQKSSVVSITDTPEDTKYELWIEDNKLNGEDVTFIHWYSKLWYIIQTN
jgi:FPC/CPF motif-containing protein YcgG